MTYGEKFKEVFGYYPVTMPCPEKCPPGRHMSNGCIEGSECEYFTDFRNKEYEEEYYCNHCERKSCMRIHPEGGE